MSRGFGYLQGDILDAARRYDEVQVNRLAWTLADARGRVERRRSQHPLSEGGLEPAFYKSFRRSVTLLRERKALRVHRRKLRSLQEMVDVYPFKSRSLRIKELRQRLLPFVQGYVANSRVMFDRAANELYMVDRWSAETRAAYDREWSALEPRVCKEASAIDANGRSVLVHIAARGCEVSNRSKPTNPFAKPSSSVTCRYSFDQLLAQLDGLRRTAPFDDEALPDDLSSLYARFFPLESLSNLSWKSQVHEVWNSAQWRTPSLELDFKRYLLDVDEAFITSLPGHVAGSGGPRGWFQDTSFDALLDRLFGRDVFAPFDYLTVT